MVFPSRAYLSRARLSGQRNTQRDLVSEGAGRVSRRTNSIRRGGRRWDGRSTHRGARLPDTRRLRPRVGVGTRDIHGLGDVHSP